MRVFAAALACGAVVMAAQIEPGRAQGGAAPPAVYVVTYFEVAAPDAAKVDDLLHKFAVATRKENGNAEVTALHQVGRSGHFAIVEAWQDKAAYDAHAAAMKTLGDSLKPLFASPFDARQFLPLSIAAPASGGNPGQAMYVLTHVDVFPAGKEEVAGLVKAHVEDSRKDKGVERFDAVVWDGHPNHFHLIEAWTDHIAQEAHAG